MLSIPLLIAFYEIKVRRYFPKLPSVFKIVSMLYRHGLLTIGTVTWFVSRLPQDMIGGLGVASGLVIHGTSAIASGATVGIAGSAAKTVTQGTNLLNPGAVATDIAPIVSGGLEGVNPLPVNTLPNAFRDSQSVQNQPNAIRDLLQPKLLGRT